MTETSGGQIIVPDFKSKVICAGGEPILGTKWKINPTDDNTGEVCLNDIYS